MSIAEIQRFAADVSSNAALRGEIEAFGQGSKAEPLDGLTAFAAAKGYSFTADELQEQAKAKAAGKSLTDTELNGVSGGTDGAVQFMINVFGVLFTPRHGR